MLLDRHECQPIAWNTLANPGRHLPDPGEVPGARRHKNIAVVMRWRMSDSSWLGGIG